ncbi:autotransporter domain-containing protein [Methylomarinum sp. Ch1-1]|uniref:Autotransporter domain-containing protein n=1 Tax=Methylomarinum roseum TaxID=3067653 RepID=A0AAU7NYM6_9GAMM|nr:autotransporter outer membrane beta-barrel domain-containing protein [Methylomarinum sp. Ch1-1]MDP4521864.1 autotransporter domain-containing protein [Methylomarinum sp. Ch1-1]
MQSPSLPVKHPSPHSNGPISTQRTATFKTPRLYGSKPIIMAALSMMALSPTAVDAWTLDFIPNSYTVDEAAGSVQVGVTLTPDSNDYGGCFVNGDVVAVGGTATAGSDYSFNGAFSVSDNSEIPPAASTNISISIIDDIDIEGPEDIQLELQNISADCSSIPINNTTSATVNISDNDIPQPGTISFDNASSSASEGNTVTVTVNRTAGSDGEARVDYATANGTAVAGSDYTEKSGTLVWNDGDASPKTITLQTLTDSDTLEQDELFSIILSNPSGATLGSVDTVDITIGNTTPTLSDIVNLTPNQRSVAEALDQSCATATGEFKQRCDELYQSGLSDGDIIQILDAIVPEQIAAQGSAAVDFGSQQLQIIHGRIIELRNNQNKNRISVLGFSMDVDGEYIPLGKIAQSAFNTALGAAAAAGDEPLRDSPLGFFLKGQIKVGDKNKTDREKGFDLLTRGITMGVDYQFTDTLVMGAAAGYGYSKTDFDSNGGEMTTQSGDFAVYGSYFMPEDFYVDWVMSYAIHDYDMDRRIVYPGMTSSATSNPQGDQYGGSLGFGKDIYIKSFFISPYVRGEYIETTIDHYDEQGGAGFALSVADQSITSISTIMGSQFGHSISMPWGVIAPAARFEWVHQFKDNERVLRSRFINASAGAGNFSILTDNPDRDYFNLSASIAATLPEGRSAFVRYETRLGQNDISNHIIELGLRIPF